MTEPSEAAKKRACELANKNNTGSNVEPYPFKPEHVVRPNHALYALALYIDKVDRVALEADGLIEDGETRSAMKYLRSLLLPDEPDLVKEAIRAAILTDATDDDSKRLRAELAKRGLTITEEK